MRSPKRTASATGIERPLRSDDSAVAVVDAALRSLRDREFLTRDEAVQVLKGVQASLSDAGSGPRLASVLNDALVSRLEGDVLDKQRVADVLLDVRLVLTD